MADRPTPPFGYPPTQAAPHPHAPIPDLRPRTGHPFYTLLGSLGISVGVAWGVVKWAATAPSREEFEHSRNDIVQVRLDQAVMKSNTERQSTDIAEIKAAVGEIRKTQLEARRGR